MIVIPPLLVQRCNGYLEVLEFSKQILLLGQLASVVPALSTPNGEEGYNSSNILQTHQYSSCASKLEVHIQPTKPQANPKRNVVCKSAPHQPQYCTYL
jgi:hypothetical protein